MAGKEEWIGLREFARRKGLKSPNGVTKALKNGRIVRRDSDGLIEWYSQSEAWANNVTVGMVRENASEDALAADGGFSVPTAKAPTPPKPKKAKKSSAKKGAAAAVAKIEADDAAEHEIEEGEDLEGDEKPAKSQSQDFQHARLRKESAEADLKELARDELRGNLVPVGHVASAMSKFAIAIRDDIVTIPDRVVGELAAEIAKLLPSGTVDSPGLERLVRSVWDRESRKVLERLASGR